MNREGFCQETVKQGRDEFTCNIPLPCPRHLQKEAVNHPNHYGGDVTYEVIKVIHAWNLGFDLGNAVKYIARAGRKNPDKEIEDLEKAEFYVKARIKFLKEGPPE